MKTIWRIIVVAAALALVLLIAVPLALLLPDTPLIGDSITVIPVKGEITLSECSAGLMAAGSCAQVAITKKMLENADKDTATKAIVLDIDSGGGSVVASRELMRAVRDTKKPVVAWIGEVGASGAYYVASGADHIVADEDSITGSISVITSVIQYYELMEKIGVNVAIIKSGESKDLGSPYRPMTGEERQELQDIVDEIHDDFIEDIAANRNLPVEYVGSIATGEIYLGDEAVEIGLVDSIGGMGSAIEMAKQLGRINGMPRIKEVRGEQSWKKLLDGFGMNIGYGIGRSM